MLSAHHPDELSAQLMTYTQVPKNNNCLIQSKSIDSHAHRVCVKERESLCVFEKYVFLSIRERDGWRAKKQ